MDNNFLIKCVTLNVKGLRNPVKRKKVFCWAKMFDIIALQETFFTQELENSLIRDWPGYSKHSFSTSKHSKGVSILINNSLDLDDIVVRCDPDGRMIMLDFRYQDSIFTVVNVYAPTNQTERKIFLEYMNNIIQHSINNNSRYFIMCGDFNTVYRPEDRMSGNLDQTSVQFDNLINSNNLIDLWLAKNEGKQQFSFVNMGNNKIQSRIDYFICSKEVEKYCKQCYITNAPVPDHKAVVMHICKNEIDIGKGYWKLNNTVLAEDDYKNGIENIFKNTVSELLHVDSKALVWDMCKIRFKAYSISYCIKRKQSKDKEIVDTEERLNRLDSLLADKNLCDDKRNKLLCEWKSLKIIVDEFYSNKARGSFIRSRAKWIEDGEKSSRYFLNLERSRQESSVIHELISDESNTTVNDTEGLLNMAKTFYQKLYTDTDTDERCIDEYLGQIRFKNKLNDTDVPICEGPIRLNECTNVIGKLNKNKSPGLDGLSAEFYQTFWSLIGSFLVEVFNECYTKGALPTSSKKSILGLIFKKGDKNLLKNYRPISLTNTDYKILAFVLSNRLHQVIDKIIEPRQSAYVKNRYIGNNIRLVDDIIHYAGYKNIGGCILFLDFKKAFDSVNWKYIFSVMKRFNFGVSFISWIKLLYKKPYACVKINGYLSDTFELKRGVRQGCPVSALIFLLVVEVMALDIEQNSSMKGFRLPHDHNLEIKVTQYADDTTLFLDDPNHAVSAIEYLNNFSKVSGLYLNKDKTEGIKLGKDKNVFFNNEINWVTNIKYLGIMLGHDHESNDTFNWKEKLSKIKSTIQVWKTRDLTQIGKIIIIKSILVSKVVFTMMNVDINCEYLNQLNNMLYQFLWPKKQWIERTVMTNNLVDGGLNMLDLYGKAESIQAKRIHRLLCNTYEIWKAIPVYYYKHELKLGDYWSKIKVFDVNNLIPLLNKIPNYHKHSLSSFAKLKVLLERRDKAKQVHCQVSVNEPIWLNHNFMWNNKPIFFQNWFKVGLLTLKDIIKRDENGSVKLDLPKIHFLVSPTNLIFERNIIHNIIRHLPSLSNETPSDKPSIETTFYYDIFKSNNCTTPRLLYWNKIIEVPSNLKMAFRRKVVQIREKKFKAFNFKLVHGILIHGSKVNKWDPTMPHDCRICLVKHTIEHMIFECILAKHILQKCTRFLNIQTINLNDIIFGVDNSISNYILTFATFTLYKYWLVTSKENAHANIENISMFFIKELNDHCAALELTNLTLELKSLKDLYTFCILS